LHEAKVFLVRKLFAFCTGLTPIRMKILGKTTLNENFEWKPQQLLAMINEIEKICPEEGTVDELVNDMQAHDANTSTDRE
jgi:hypothetical protein